MGKKKKNRIAPETMALPSGGVETHAHLDMERFSEDLAATLERARNCGVSHFGQVFLGPEQYHAGKALFDEHPDVFFMLGVHPHDAKTVSDDTLQAMKDIFRVEPRMKALGEIGLDFYYDKSPREEQCDAFRKQLALAKELELPVVIHSRDAFEETLDILEGMGFKGYPVLWHCFGEDVVAAQCILDNGWLLSIPGPITYKKNEIAQEAVVSIPLDRLVLETDCPYLAPEPWRGKRNEPAFLVFTAAKVAELKQVSPEDIWRASAKNALKFFRI